MGSPLSSALTAIAQPGPHPLPAALVAGYYTNWSSLDTGSYFVNRLKAACRTDPLAQSFTSNGWPTNFGSTNNSNDGIVAVTSQLNGPSSSPLLFPNLALAHSPGLVSDLSFTGPSVLDSGNGTPVNPIANQVITLLNTPVNQAPFVAINP